MRVRITGWHLGLRKVSLTHAIQSVAGLDLKDAKQLTDQLLDGEPVEVDAQNLTRAQAFIEGLREIGADGEIVRKHI